MNNKMKLTSANKKTLPEIKQYLRGKVPILNPSKFRRTKMPLHKAIVAELKDEGLTSSSNLLEDLLTIDSELQRGNELLKDSKSDLLFIKRGLEKADRSGGGSNFDDGISAYLSLAHHFEEKNNISFYWVAKEFYEIAVKLSEDDLVDKSKGSKAFSNFYFGRFLNLKLKKFEESLEHLTIAEECAVGHDDWFIDDKVLSGFIEWELVDTLIKFAEDTLKKDAEKALKITQRALEAVSGVDDLEFQLKRHMKIGDIFTFLKKYPEATGSYKLALKNAKKLSKLDKQCQIHMKIGTSYKDLQEFDKAERSFQNAWQLADKNKFQEELAEVSSKLAGILIEKNDIKGAKEYIKKAMEISLELGNQKLQMEARIMSGLATAQEMFGPMVETIHKAENGRLFNNEHLQKLYKWSDRKVPCWDQHASQMHKNNQMD